MRHGAVIDPGSLQAMFLGQITCIFKLCGVGNLHQFSQTPTAIVSKYLMEMGYLASSSSYIFRSSSLKAGRITSLYMLNHVAQELCPCSITSSPVVLIRNSGNESGSLRDAVLALMPPFSANLWSKQWETRGKGAPPLPQLYEMRL